MDASRHPRQAALLTIIFLLNGTEFLQSGMIAFSAGAVMAQINASADEFIFATILYGAIAITVIAAQHWFVERLGWRTYIRLSAVLFVLGGAICATSDSLAPFLLGRAVMACGGAGFMTAARLLVNLIPPTPERMKGIAAFGSALALGNALGPWIASSGVGADNWTVIFAVPAGMAILSALLSGICLPISLTPDRDRSQSNPWLGAGLLGASLLVLYALQRAMFDFYSAAAPLVVCLGAGLLGLVLLIRHQVRHDRPMMVLGRLAQPRYLTGLALFVFCYVILGANNMMLPVLLQSALGAAWQAVGEVQTIGLMSSIFAFIMMVAVLKRSPSPRKFYLAGFGFLFYFAWQLSRLTVEANLWRDVLPAIAAFGVFLILVLGTTAIHAFADLQQDTVAFNHGQMLKNMMSQFGIALGVAGATVVTQWRVSEHYAALGARFHGSDAVFVAMRDQLAAKVGLQQATARVTQMLMQQANLLAGLDYFSVLMLVALAATAVMMGQRILK
jgi:MFS transporter, DHA2 family, multidrug resistance protein